jgi:hypothetical protein
MKLKNGYMKYVARQVGSSVMERRGECATLTAACELGLLLLQD